MRIRSPHFKKEYELSKAELIGEGNFAQVYRIFDEHLKDSLAIRKVRKNESDMEDIKKEKVINEELKKVQNENILKIYDIIDTEEAVWYITEYCSGGSLWDVLNLCKDNKMNEKECLQCVLQISKGVQELHNHRITHRDLKPENILLKTKYTPNKPLPVVKLADFGLSTQKIIMETIAGTKEYIAPEQAKFHNYTNAVDVWSLGIICDEILHGNPFYSGENNKEVFNKILKMPYRVRDDQIRQSIQNLLISLLKKKPYERPIIAVIRKTIEKIIEEIQAEKGLKKTEKEKERAPLQIERKKTTEVDSESSFSNSTSSGFRSNGKQSPVFERERQKQTEKNPQEEKDSEISMHKKQVPYTGRTNRVAKQHSAINSEQQLSRSGAVQAEVKLSRQRKQFIRTKHSGEKDLQKVESSVPRAKDAKINTPRGSKDRSKIQNEEKSNQSSLIHQIGRNQSAIDEQKSQYKCSVTEQNKKESAVESENNGQGTQKKQSYPVPLYKVDRKKAPLVRNEEKRQTIDAGVFVERVTSAKKQLFEKHACLKFQKSASFLPNTVLSANQFTVSSKDIEPLIREFKSEYTEVINGLKFNDAYDMKLSKHANQLQKNESKVKEGFKKIKEDLKEQFFDQLDRYIDSFVEKNVK